MFVIQQKIRKKAAILVTSFFYNYNRSIRKIFPLTGNMETNRRDIIMSFAIKEIYVEYQKAPIGLDEKCPRFSWIFSSDEKI